MRVMRAGKVLGHDWKGFHVWRGVLCTPEGHQFTPGDLAWQSLLVQQARAFRHLLRERQTAHSGREPAQPALGLSLYPSKLNISGEHGSRDIGGQPPISHPRDTLDQATDALHGSGPGAVIPDKVLLQPLAPRRIAGARS